MPVTNCPNFDPVDLSIGDNTYTFQFQGVTIVNGNYRWCYNVSVETVSGGGLSHFVLEFCPEIVRDNLVQVLVDGQPILEDMGDPNFEFGNFDEGDGPIYGLKINITLETDGTDSAEICFDLNDNFTSEPGDVAIKAGQNEQTFEDALCTPCNAISPTRGILI